MRLSPFANKHTRALRHIDRARRLMQPWAGPAPIPWSDPDFSRRMLRVHLDPTTDRGTRRPEVVSAHVEWLLQTLQATGAGAAGPLHILDIGCGPGLYCHDLARRGHRATGLDIAPAALEHARDIAEGTGLDCRFLAVDLEDLPADLPERVTGAYGPADAVTWWFGDFHGFSAARAPEIIGPLAACLRPGGLFVLEYQPLEHFVTEGGTSWELVPTSPFCDEPHLWLQEYAWHADVRTESHVHWILEIDSGNLQEYCQCHQGWSDTDLDAMLAGCGLVDPVRCDPITGIDPQLEFPLVVTRRCATSDATGHAAGRDDGTA